MAILHELDAQLGQSTGRRIHAQVRFASHVLLESQRCEVLIGSEAAVYLTHMNQFM